MLRGPPVKNKLDLLVSLKSGTIDIWDLFYLLYFREDSDILEIIINKLYEFEPKELEFFLPQLW
jgi:hypothetical protein